MKIEIEIEIEIKPIPKKQLDTKGENAWPSTMKTERSVGIFTFLLLSYYDFPSQYLLAGRSIN